jgi:hypothetical protein
VAGMDDLTNLIVKLEREYAAKMMIEILKTIFSQIYV